MLVPEGVQGFNPNYRSSVAYNPLLANKLLDRFGYKKGCRWLLSATELVSL